MASFSKGGETEIIEIKSRKSFSFFCGFLRFFSIAASPLNNFHLLISFLIVKGHFLEATCVNCIRKPLLTGLKVYLEKL